MIKFVEMDKNVTINDQIKEEQGNKNGDSVILINKFDVSPDKNEQFLRIGQRLLVCLNNNLDL